MFFISGSYSIKNNDGNGTQRSRAKFSLQKCSYSFGRSLKTRCIGIDFDSLSFPDFRINFPRFGDWDRSLGSGHGVFSIQFPLNGIV